MSATGAVTPGSTSDLKTITAGFDFGRISKYSPRRTAKRKRPVTNIAEASVARIAGISTKAMSQPFTKPISAIARMARMMAGGPVKPALISVLKVVAPATIAATCDRSRPRETMTTAIPQLRMTSDVELERMTERFPSVANPLIVREKRTISARVTAMTIGSSRLRRGLLPALMAPLAVASTMEVHFVRAFGLKNFAGLGGARNVQRQVLEDPPDLQHLRGA